MKRHDEIDLQLDQEADAIEAEARSNPLDAFRADCLAAAERKRMGGWTWRIKTMYALIALAKRQKDPAALVLEFFALGLGELVPMTEDELLREVQRRGRMKPA